MSSVKPSPTRPSPRRRSAMLLVPVPAGEVLVFAQGEDKWLTAVTAGQRGIRAHVRRYLEVNRPPLAGAVVGVGFRRNQRNRLSSGQVDALCHIGLWLSGHPGG